MTSTATPKGKPWKVVVLRRSHHRHVYPLHDDRPHILTPACPCRPFLIDSLDQPPIWVHNAFDRREYAEYAALGSDGRPPFPRRQ